MKYLLSCFTFFCLFPALATEKSAPHLCQKYVLRAEAKYEIPHGLLAAISIIETGTSAKKFKDPVAWPWVINVQGKPSFFNTKTDAALAINKHINNGITNIDIGCMQLNYRYHGSKFMSIANMLDPRRNTEYAAKFLKRLHKRHKSWTKAVGFYHSGTLKHQVPYRHKVYRTWHEVRHKMPKLNRAEDVFMGRDKQTVEQQVAQEVMKQRLIAKQENQIPSAYDIIRPEDPVVSFQHEAKETTVALKEEEQLKKKSHKPLVIDTLTSRATPPQPL